MAAVECDPPGPSSRNSFLSLFPKRLKTSESSNSSENSKLGENTDDEQIAQAKTKRERVNSQAKTKCMGKEKADIDSNLEFPSHSQDELKKIYGERTQRDFKLAFDSEELESSEEEEGISDAEFKKTKGWKLLMEALDSKFERKHQAKP